MTDTRSWHTRGVCPECGWHKEAHFGDTFHMGGVSCCPICGRHKGQFRDDWEVKTMRYEEDTSYRWWNPSTWNLPGKWVTRGEEKDG